MGNDKKKKQKGKNKNKQKRIYNRQTFSQRMAIGASRVIGGWWFIVIQTFFILGWIVLNVVGYIRGWDAYPFVFLNLMLSISAAYAAPVILMAQNRDAERDRTRSIVDLATDRRAERGIQEIRKTVNRIEQKINNK